MRFRIKNIFRTECSPGRARSGKSVGWTLKVVDFSGETLGNLDTYYHPDAGQILTTTLLRSFNLYHVMLFVCLPIIELSIL